MGLVDYLKGTQEKLLVLCINNDIPIAKWYVDAAFAVHPDFRSHTGGLLKFGHASGTIASSSLK